MAKHHSVTRLPDLAGAPPQLATVQDLLGANPFHTGHEDRKRSSKKKGSINLVPVYEALIDEGLDPTVEMIRILKAKVIVTDRSGQPVLDQDGKHMMVDAVDNDTKLRVLNELLSYTQPKLKAVEMRVSGHLELSNDQLDQRLQALMAKALV